jgi:hypothetical protein
MAAALSSGALSSTLVPSRPLLPALVQARRCYSRTRRLRRSTHRPRTPHRPHGPLSLLHPLTAPPPPPSPARCPSLPPPAVAPRPLPDKSLSPSTRDAPRHACRQVLSPPLHPRPPRLSPTSLARACACARDSPTLPLSPPAPTRIWHPRCSSPFLSLYLSLSVYPSLALFHRFLRPPTTQHARDHLAHLLTHALVRLRLRC